MTRSSIVPIASVASLGVAAPVIACSSSGEDVLGGAHAFVITTFRGTRWQVWPGLVVEN